MTVIFYARVSTVDQNLHHQLTQAQTAGFQIDEVISDHGVSGVSTTLDERPEGRRLFDKLRAGDTLVVRWIDRLGRNYRDVTDTIRHFMREGVTIKTVINDMSFDGATKDPMQQAIRDSLVSFMAAMAQAQAEITKEAQKAGIAAAKQDGRKYLGKKPSYSRGAFQVVQNMLFCGGGASEISKATGLSRQTVLRIKSHPAGAEAALVKWGL